MPTTDESVVSGCAENDVRREFGDRTALAVSPSSPPRRVTIVVEGHGSAAASSEERVLVALERAQGFGRLTDLPRKLPVGCRRGGCGICRVRVLEGDYRVGPMSRAHVSPEDEAAGVVLSCAIWANGDLVLRFEPPDLGKKTKGDTAP